MSSSPSRVHFNEVLPSPTVERRRMSGTIVYPTVAQRKGSLDRASKDLRWLGGTICSSPTCLCPGALQEASVPETNTVVTGAPHDTNTNTCAMLSEASSNVSDSVGSSKN